jgi:hypothetical protein
MKDESSVALQMADVGKKIASLRVASRAEHAD